MPTSTEQTCRAVVNSLMDKPLKLEEIMKATGLTRAEVTDSLHDLVHKGRVRSKQLGDGLLYSLDR